MSGDFPCSQGIFSCQQGIFPFQQGIYTLPACYLYPISRVLIPYQQGIYTLPAGYLYPASGVFIPCQRGIYTLPAVYLYPDAGYLYPGRQGISVGILYSRWPALFIIPEKYPDYTRKIPDRTVYFGVGLGTSFDTVRSGIFRVFFGYF